MRFFPSLFFGWSNKCLGRSRRVLGVPRTLLFLHTMHFSKCHFFKLPIGLPVELPIGLPIELPIEFPIVLPFELPIVLPTALPIVLPIASPIELPIAY